MAKAYRQMKRYIHRSYIDRDKEREEGRKKERVKDIYVQTCIYMYIYNSALSGPWRILSASSGPWRILPASSGPWRILSHTHALYTQLYK